MKHTVRQGVREIEHEQVLAEFQSRNKEIVTAKVMDGQLDNCPLTLQDVAQIRKVFTETLIHILHQRIAYPKPEESTHAPA